MMTRTFVAVTGEEEGGGGGQFQLFQTVDTVRVLYVGGHVGMCAPRALSDAYILVHVFGGRIRDHAVPRHVTLPRPTYSLNHTFTSSSTDQLPSFPMLLSQYLAK